MPWRPCSCNFSVGLRASAGEITGRRREGLKCVRYARNKSAWSLFAVGILFVLILFFLALVLESPSTLAPSARDPHGSGLARDALAVCIRRQRARC